MNFRTWQARREKTDTCRGVRVYSESGMVRLAPALTRQSIISSWVCCWSQFISANWKNAGFLDLGIVLKGNELLDTQFSVDSILFFWFDLIRCKIFSFDSILYKIFLFRIESTLTQFLQYVFKFQIQCSLDVMRKLLSPFNNKSPKFYGIFLNLLIHIKLRFDCIQVSNKMFSLFYAIHGRQEIWDKIKSKLFYCWAKKCSYKMENRL